MKLKNLYYIYIYILIGALSFFACSDDHLAEEQPVEYCVSVDWSNGRGGGTRALSSLLGAEGGDLVISPADYPDEINVKCNGKDFWISKSASLEACSSHTGFYHGYTSSDVLKDKEAQKGVTAIAYLDDGDDVLYCEENDVELDGVHLKFTFHHSKALLRFAFRVDKYYDKIRFIKVTQIKLNDINCSLEEKVLNKDSYLYVAYLYVGPDFSVSESNTIECTYNIYGKDGTTDEHLTREGVTATNKFTLESLKDAGGTKVSQLQAGYYYDLNVTINPDYLYVLSEHDNKQHLTVE